MRHFDLSEEQQLIQEQTQKLTADIAAPTALEHDEHSTFVDEGVEALTEMMLFGLPVAEEAGGAGFDMLSLVVAVEEIARGCGSTARLLQMQGGGCAKALEGLEAGAEALAKVVTGEEITSFLGLEHGITAAIDGDGVRLTGTAPLVTGGAKAGLFVVAAMADGEPILAVVPADGCKVEAVPSLGFRATAPARVSFDGASAPVTARGAGAGAAIARAELALWIAGAALAVGTGFASVEATRRHTAERIAFGKPLQKQQAVAHKLVESKRAIEAARHQTWHAARLADAGDLEAAREAALMARLGAVDAALHAADEAIQAHGGYGFTVEYHVERHYRDMQTLETLERGAEWMRDQLSLGVLGG